MTASLIAADPTSDYEIKEAAVIVAAFAFILAVGGVALAAVLICGWKGAKSVIVDWIHGKATFVCK
ncbi:MAG: hypothetical protein K0S68_158 [Candidatus Saccharibacteria bacterium]|jgi:hypothetical protein|nr:hypothetical protein [Candidatus Saccharibacteria bacterium]